jgi:HK97 gp10 family phage protein
MSNQTIKGLSDLQKFLDQLPAKMEANIMRGALRTGCNVIKKQAAANIHRVSGELEKSLGVVARRTKGRKVAVSVFAGRGFGKKGMPPSNQPIWVEYGTAAHWINVKKEERAGLSVRKLNKYVASGSLKIGGAFIGSSVAHPGARPQPFMRPALDAKSQDAVLAAAEYIKKRLATKHGLDTSDVNIEVEA